MHPLKKQGSTTKKENQTIIIEHKNTKYKININKLQYTIKLLKNNPDFKFKNNQHILTTLKEHSLLHKDFLSGINNLW